MGEMNPRLQRNYNPSTKLTSNKDSPFMLGVDQALIQDQSNNNGSRPPTFAGVNQAATKNNLYEGL
jgi:hypothetical protein